MGPTQALCMCVTVGLFVGAGPVPGTRAGFWEPSSHAAMLCPALMQREELGLALA